VDRRPAEEAQRGAGPAGLGEPGQVTNVGVDRHDRRRQAGGPGREHHTTPGIPQAGVGAYPQIRAEIGLAQADRGDRRMAGGDRVRPLHAQRRLQ
jgi:hypothetical protein